MKFGIHSIGIYFLWSLVKIINNLVDVRDLGAKLANKGTKFGAVIHWMYPSQSSAGSWHTNNVAGTSVCLLLKIFCNLLTCCFVLLSTINLDPIKRQISLSLIYLQLISHYLFYTSPYLSTGGGVNPPPPKLRRILKIFKTFVIFDIRKKYWWHVEKPKIFAHAFDARECLFFTNLQAVIRAAILGGQSV